MHSLILNQAVIFSLLFHVSHCQRRIVNGAEVTEPKRYVVYLVEARISPMEYDEWLCGGALVTQDFILTSAACIEDVKHLYAVAGYKKYVTKDELYTDKCTSKTKKKIILTCVPKSYELNYDKLEKWSFIDIAVAKVESPYEDNDKNFETLCSYIPQPIEINFEPKYQFEGTDAIALGWGHSTKWRMDSDVMQYNSIELQYTPILIADKEECKKEYQHYKGMDKVIDTYMICSIKEGNINSKGGLRSRSKPTANGCPGQEINSIEVLMGKETKSPECQPAAEVDDMAWIQNTRRNNTNISDVFETNTNDSEDFDAMYTRRNGICQNDHGGPIVTWIGSEEYLIGVASVFKVSKDMECIGPYLYTSTECNGAFLACVLGLEHNEETRRTVCSGSPAEKGFDTLETHISWQHHPDGPSDNERNNASLTNATSTLLKARPTDNERINASLTNATSTLLKTIVSKNEQVNASLTNATRLLQKPSASDGKADNSSLSRKILQPPQPGDIIGLLSNDGDEDFLENPVAKALFTQKVTDQTITNMTLNVNKTGIDKSLLNTTTGTISIKQTIQQIKTSSLSAKAINVTQKSKTTSTSTTTKIIQQTKTGLKPNKGKVGTLLNTIASTINSTHTIQPITTRLTNSKQRNNITTKKSLTVK